MLTDTQVHVLTAVNDFLDIHDELNVDPNDSLPALFGDLGLVDKEIRQALGDLHQLELIEGVVVEEWRYPIRVTAVTARGRQELP